MKNSVKKSIVLSDYEKKLIDKALIVALSIYNSDSEQFDYVKVRFQYLFDLISKDSLSAADLCIKFHSIR